MLNLPSPGLRARIALDKHGFKTTHSLGQNFLLDDAFLGELLDAAGVGGEDCVLEIGPGAGVMTALLAQRARKVLAVEVDEKLRPVLADVLAPHENAEVIYCDFMRADVDAMTQQAFGGAPFRVVANLPYYITADILLRLLACKNLPGDIAIMVQKEAAERLMSNPGTKNWCALAATVRYYGDCEILEEVPPQMFNPPPHVDSCFIRICMHEKRMLDGEAEQRLLGLIRCCFHMRRKTLTNNLKACFNMKQAEATAALARAGLAPQVRGEALSLEEMVRLSEVLFEK